MTAMVPITQDTFLEQDETFLLQVAAVFGQLMLGSVTTSTCFIQDPNSKSHFIFLHNYINITCLLSHTV